MPSPELPAMTAANAHRSPSKTAVVALASDLHWERDRTASISAEGAGALLAVGDFLHGDEPGTAVPMLAAAAQGKPVFYVPGNHEFEGRTLQATMDRLRAAANGTSVHVLDRTALTWKNVRILGATLWSGFSLYGEDARREAMEDAERRFRDLKTVVNPDGSRWGAAGALDEHRRSVEWLDAELDRADRDGLPALVLTHFAPARPSEAAHFRESRSSAYFVNPLESLVERAALWCHGHTHQTVGYRVGQRSDRGAVWCNARGFSGRDLSKLDPKIADAVRAKHANRVVGDWLLPENPFYARPLLLDLNGRRLDQGTQGALTV